MESPLPYLDDHADELVVLDEIHRLPGLFGTLREVIDAGRREGKAAGRFLLLGSAGLDLLAQSGETLAGRISIVELGPFDLTEVGANRLDDLWVRGGFPDSLLAPEDEISLAWRTDFIRTYLERDIPQFGRRVPAETLRRLSPRHANVGKRLVRSPKVYIRDSGLVHALLGIEDKEALLGHPVVGASWEGMAIENLLLVLADKALPSFYRTARGAEVDLVLDWPDGRVWAIEIKRTSVPKLERGLRSALDDLKPQRSFVVYAGAERFRLAEQIEAIGLAELCAELAA